MEPNCYGRHAYRCSVCNIKMFGSEFEENELKDCQWYGILIWSGFEWMPQQHSYPRPMHSPHCDLQLVSLKCLNQLSSYTFRNCQWPVFSRIISNQMLHAMSSTSLQVIFTDSLHSTFVLSNTSPKIFEG